MSAQLDRDALRAALRAVPGVLDADLDPDEHGGPGTLRLDLAPGVDEAEVAGQVGRVLRERFGLGVDAARASALRDEDIALVEEVVAEAVPEPVVVPPAETAARPVQDVSEVRSMSLPVPRSSTRPAIAKMHLVSAGLEVSASVTLASGERTAKGEARGTATTAGVHRAVATATLRAVEGLVGSAARLELEHLDVAQMGTERTVVVLLTLLTARGGETLTGAAAVRDDVRQAVIRATLDALNRRLELLLTEV